MKNIAIFAVLATFLSGCSGKVQINEIPKERTFIMGNHKSELNNSVPNELVADFDDYAKHFFKATPQEYKKSIYQIGIDRGHYDD